tara:strand:- start:4023 stop:5180 length:1158 start_codon:yes stop_codon:yes gene_type:complete
LKKEYDIIFCGCGLSTLIFLQKIISDSYFDNKSILVIEKNAFSIPKKTWSFWDSKNSKWNDFVIKSWDNISFKSYNFNTKKKLDTINYKMIKSEPFYKKILDDLKSLTNITFHNAEVKSVQDTGNLVKVTTDSNQFLGNKVFNSIIDNSYLKDDKYPVLLQHFMGWSIKVNEDIFDENTALLMDFSIKQNDETRFFYVLPISRREALVEFTLFSKNKLDDKQYEVEIINYLSSLKIDNYTINESEKGVIPMTCYPFDKKNSKNLIHIGTAGGWTKPSTGYTFRFIDKYSSKLIDFLKSNKSLKKFKTKNRFWFYDLLFIDVLYFNNKLGSNLFERLFKNNKFSSIFKFLDNESNFIDEIKIINSFPKWVFIKSLIKNISKIIYRF